MFAKDAINGANYAKLVELLLERFAYNSRNGLVEALRNSKLPVKQLERDYKTGLFKRANDHRSNCVGCGENLFQSECRCLRGELDWKRYGTTLRTADQKFSTELYEFSINEQDRSVRSSSALVPVSFCSKQLLFFPLPRKLPCTPLLSLLLYYTFKSL